MWHRARAWAVFVLTLTASLNVAAETPTPRQYGTRKNTGAARDETHKVPLNNTGIADVRFINPRAPFPLNPNRLAADETERKREDGIRGLEFQNRTADRKFKVTMAVTLPAQVPRTPGAAQISIAEVASEATPEARRKQLLESLRAIYGAYLTGCKPEGATFACTAMITLERTRLEGSAIFTRQLFMDDVTPGEVLTFTVRRYRENEALRNATGYVRKFAAFRGGEFVKVAERPDKTTLTPVASVGLNTDRRLSSAEQEGERIEIVTADNPFRGARRTHSPGSARVDIRHNLGNRANADLSFRFKREDLGDQDESSDVQARKYKLSVFALNQTTLEFGKYDFLTPASEVALSLRGGQGFTVSRPLNIGNVRLSYIAQRESDPTAENDKGDHSDYIVEWNEINLPGNADLHANLLAVYGSDDDPADRHAYRAFGTELFYGRPIGTRTALGATVAAFRVNRSRSYGASADNQDDTPRGSGTVLYGRSTFSLDVADAPAADEATVGHTLGLTIAAANGDDPSTSLNEGYIGESQAFEPDQIFFSSLAGPLSAPNGSAFEPGIANKLYVAADYSTDAWSLLQLFARGVGVDPSDIVAKSTTLSVHHYRSRREIAGRKPLGVEYGVLFEIETPAAVTVSLGSAYFVPAKALHPLFAKNVWSVTAGVKIEP